MGTWSLGTFWAMAMGYYYNICKTFVAWGSLRAKIVWYYNYRWKSFGVKALLELGPVLLLLHSIDIWARELLELGICGTNITSIRHLTLGQFRSKWTFGATSMLYYYYMLVIVQKQQLHRAKSLSELEHILYKSHKDQKRLCLWP